jgi:hypothetical protein
MSSFLEQTWVMATVQLVNQERKVGTGFFVVRQVEGGQRLFIVTNKHVLGDSRESREAAQTIEVRLNVTRDGRIQGYPVTYQVRDPNGTVHWREHPDPDVDVMAFDATVIAIKITDLSSKWADYSLFIDEKKVEEHDISMGDDVVILGYPLAVHQGNTFLPMLKSGTLGSKLGLKLQDSVPVPGGGARSRELPAFLVDGAIVPGSSGSPVVLKPVPGRIVKGNIFLGVPPPFLLGIISETKTVEIVTPKGPALSIPGLAIAFDASTIREVIESFFG